MKCDQCENEATVHEWTKEGGQRHLCERCAMKAGLPVQPQTQISQMIAQSIASLLQPATEPAEATTAGQEAQTPAAGEAPAKPVGPCVSCGMELSQFRNTGLLGCPACYTAFESQLAPLIWRAHEGATHHTGKVPRLPAGASGSTNDPGVAGVKDERLAKAMRLERTKRLETLKRQLGEAVAAEQYERAAKMRDEVAQIERELTQLTVRPPPAEGGPVDRGGAGGDAA